MEREINIRTERTPGWRQRQRERQLNPPQCKVRQGRHWMTGSDTTPTLTTVTTVTNTNTVRLTILEMREEEYWHYLV